MYRGNWTAPLNFGPPSSYVPQQGGPSQGPPQSVSNSIEGIRCNNFTKLWDSRKTGAKMGEFAVFRVEPPQGYVRIGDYIEKTNATYPTGSAVVVREVPRGGFPLLAPPIRYVKLWDDKGSGGKFGNVSFWRPVAPAGYVALGDIALPNHGLKAGPSTEYMMCVHESILAKGTWPENPLWTDRGTGAKSGNASMWEPEAGENGTPCATFICNGSYSQPKDNERPAWVLGAGRN